MFKVLDSKQRKLWIKDKIEYSYTEGPQTYTIQGIVIGFPEESKVQIQPIDLKGKDDGLPIICDGQEVTQLDSLAERALTLTNKADFQALIEEATVRYLAAVKEGKKKKAGTRGGTTKAPPPAVVVDKTQEMDF